MFPVSFRKQSTVPPSLTRLSVKCNAWDHEPCLLLSVFTLRISFTITFYLKILSKRVMEASRLVITVPHCYFKDCFQRFFPEFFFPRNQACVALQSTLGCSFTTLKKQSVFRRQECMITFMDLSRIESDLCPCEWIELISRNTFQPQQKLRGTRKTGCCARGLYERPWCTNLGVPWQL